MKFLYARCSTLDQNLSRQLVDESSYDRVYKEQISAKDTQRPELKALLSNLRPGDIIEVHSLDRLARNLSDLLSIVNEIKAKECSINFLKENLSFGAGLDNPFQKMTLSLLGTFAEFERNMLLMRQREGIAIAKAQGKYSQAKRKKLSPEQVNQLKQDKENGMKQKDLLAKYKISKQTLYNYCPSHWKSMNPIQP